MVDDGKRAASTAITVRPARAKAVAAALPAQRAPTTTTSTVSCGTAMAVPLASAIGMPGHRTNQSCHLSIISGPIIARPSGDGR